MRVHADARWVVWARAYEFGRKDGNGWEEEEEKEEENIKIASEQDSGDIGWRMAFWTGLDGLIFGSCI